ncbi:phage/plasmid replication domain-containing protein [Polystyrenella longa]|uniref:phage/plasmid replication domain-containing protein n=1 Tax=Polystyrenella longa TaxID=2528007 RepID=UPI0011A875DD|nr:phage/plasmid replication protein [Polystyrenella longa]
MAFNDSPLETGGFDWLGLSCHGSFEKRYWEKLRSLLDRAQEASQSDDFENSMVTLTDEIEIEVLPSGTGRGYAYCRWQFNYRGITFGVADQQTSDTGDPKISRRNLAIQITSLPLMMWGELHLYDELRNIFLALGYCPSSINPSRVDFCVDLVDTHVREFVDAVNGDCYVSRTRKNDVIRDRKEPQTIQFGTRGASTKLRIYDKIEETKNHQAKYELLVENRWGKHPDSELGATRVEFEVRRNSLLNQHGINDFKDLMEKRNDLSHYLCYLYFRLTEFAVDPNHTERGGVSPLWMKVIAAFDAWTGPTIKERDKREKIGGDVERLVKQGVGCFKSALAYLGKLPNTPVEVQFELNLLLQEYYQPMIKDIPKIRKKIEARHPYMILTQGKTKAA